MQILTWAPNPQLLSSSHGDRQSMADGITLHPVASAEFTSVTDGQTDRPRYGNSCHCGWHHWLVLSADDNRIE